MNQGDRVLITDKKHPWYGHTGVLGDEMALKPGSAAPKAMYVVRLDNGMGAGCFLEQLKKL